MQFTVNEIRNPGTLDATEPIVLYLRTSSAIIDMGTYSFPQNSFTASYIATFTVTPSSYQAGATDVTYSFKIIPLSIVNRYSYIELTLPSEVGVANANLIEYNCGGSVSGFTDTSLYCSVSG